jgi:hypothetical protein
VGHSAGSNALVVTAQVSGKACEVIAASALATASGDASLADVLASGSCWAAGLLQASETSGIRTTRVFMIPAG